MAKKSRYRLGLDLGANSLGWCLIELSENNDPIGLLRMGARIFRDGRNPKDKASLAVARRMARGMRRRRDRWLKRQQRFMEAMIKHGLMPENIAERKLLTKLDPYSLRAKALDQALSPHQVGRALFHINQRRGFKSNRKVDKSDEKESGKIKNALKEVQARLQSQGARTVGEWLAKRHESRLPVRARLRGQGAKAAYELYIGRDMIAAEFDAIWAAQAAHQPSIFGDMARDELREILLRQRDLKPVRPGRCTLDPEDPRAPLALPSSQRFRILQELNNIRYSADLGEETRLSKEQRDHFAGLLEGQKIGKRRALTVGKLTFDRMRQLLKLPDNARFNLESDRRDGLKGNATSLAMSKADRFGDAWHTLPLSAQDAVIELLLTEENEVKIVASLCQRHALSEEAAFKIANSGLADGHSNLGRKALAGLIPALASDVITYDKAVKLAGYTHHSQLHTGEIYARLPYYGIALPGSVGFGSGDPKHSEERRYGRIANPTVHIGLNQIRRLVNAIIERYGPPTQVALEVTRELKQSRDQKDRVQKEQAGNQAQRDADREELRNLGLRESGENLLRFKLWRELNLNDPLNRCCPYTGRQIGKEKLFSEEVEIEHILPFSLTLDDSIANKTLAYREANRFKKNGTPYEAFGQSAEWSDIQARAQNMPRNKQWRFADNAMDLFNEKHGGDFLARHLNDTAYLSRSTKAYLSTICNPNDVWVTPGRLTALLRGKWGLSKLLAESGEKERIDHRHHAIDAAVIAVTDRALLSKIATLSGQERLERLKDRIKVPYPWEGYRDALAAALPRIVISYKPDHGIQAGLHNDTAYGFTEPYVSGQASTVVRRVPISWFSTLQKLDSIRDLRLRERIKQHVGAAEGKTLAASLAEFSQQSGVSRLRVTETLMVVPLYRKTPRNSEDIDLPYKGYKGDSNYCVEIYRDDIGKWRDHIVTSFEAASIARQDSQRLQQRMLAQNGAPLIMRLCSDDTLAIGLAEDRIIYRVVKFSKGKLTIAEHSEGGDLKRRHDDKNDLFSYVTKAASWFKNQKARRVFVTELGFVLDPGFKP